MGDVARQSGDYQFQLTALRAENEHLRRSAQAFGELAERLNGALAAAVQDRRPDAVHRCCRCHREPVVNQSSGRHVSDLRAMTLRAQVMRLELSVRDPPVV